MTIRMQNVFLCGLATMAGWASYTLLPAQEVQREPGNTGVIKGKLNGAETFFVTGNTIKGAPYSAEAVTESTQVLADGNRIVRTNKEKLYRDGQGRQRSEVIAADGTAGPVTISDPVANSTLAVNPRTRTVQKAPFMRFRVNAGGTGVAEIQTLVSELASVQAGARGGARGGAPPEGGAGGRGTPAGVRLEGRLIAPGSENAPKREDLGSRNVEGVIASGTRTTRTIPAGQVGNQQPIEIVDEVWYSDEIKGNVMTRHNDPRTGETVYRLTNIFRGEPDASLFQAPLGYNVVEGPQGRGGGKQ